MPYAPKRPCRKPGCRNLCERGQQFCEDHRKELQREYNRYARDQTVQAFYDSPVWRATRKRKLAEQPCCEECLRHGKITPAVLVDHIVPIRQGGAGLDFRNLQSLCPACHGRKSVEEGSRFGDG